VLPVTEFLLNNPLADLSGFTFWLLFLGLVVALVIIGRLGLRSLDETASLPQIPTPVHPEPYELAYLRGGQAGLIDTVMFNLIDQGYLHFNNQSAEATVRQATHPPAWQRLLPLERLVFDHLARPIRPADLLQQPDLAAQLRPYFARYDQILLKKEMLTSSSMRWQAWTNLVNLILVIILFAGYKGYVALQKTNVSLFMITVFSLIGIAAVVYWGRLPRLSERGRIYLAQLQRAFSELKTRPDLTPSPQAQGRLTLALGLFGWPALAGTRYDPLQAALAKPATSSTGRDIAIRLWERWVRR
jgi:uncharacterized protein (TIGR04222 family)